MTYPVLAHPGRTQQSTVPVARHWLLTVWAALAALAICVVAVFYTPLEQPAAWRSAESSVVSLGRHAIPGDGLRL